MKNVCILSIIFLFASCDPPTPPLFANSRISAYVHWEDQPQAGKKIQLLETNEIKYTDSTGIAQFVVVAGNYTVRAFGINWPGPGFQYVDFDVVVKPTENVTVDIVDCLYCR